jgi:hypothetical protein
MTPVQSTTAWARGSALDATFERIADSTPRDPKERICVEISVGARPVQDPEALLQLWSDDFSYLAHHTVALIPGGVLRPETHAPRDVLPTLARLGIDRYTIHAPSRLTCRTEAEFLLWALSWLEEAAAHGITLRLEAMYQPRSPRDAAIRHGFHLDTYDTTMRFIDEATSRGWHTPLLLDLSHLFIGVHHKDWTDAQVQTLVASGLADHFHLSANDGTLDQHVSIPPQHVVWEWAELIPEHSIIVDEAKRALSHTVA